MPTLTSFDFEAVAVDDDNATLTIDATKASSPSDVLYIAVFDSPREDVTFTIVLDRFGETDFSTSQSAMRSLPPLFAISALLGVVWFVARRGAKRHDDSHVFKGV